MRLRSTAFHLFVLGAASLAVPFPAASAADAPARYQMSSHYQLRLNDKLEKEARFYQVLGGVPRLVIVVPGMPQAVLVAAGEKTASALDPTRVTPSADDPDTVTVSPSPVAPQTSPVTIDGTKLRFALGPSKMIVEPHDALTGEVTPEQLLAYSPEYRRLSAAYKPGRGDLRLLETLPAETELDVFFGSWCPHCEQMIPRLLRVLQELKTGNLKVHLHGVPTKIDEDPLARQYKVVGVPTGILHRGSERLATLEGQNWERPESTLAALLFGAESLAATPASK
jgi:thiol-disulfide isomerase/thioredoxin